MALRWGLLLLISLGLITPELQACKCANRGPLCRWFPSSNDPAFVGRVVEMEPGSSQEFRTRIESALRPYIGDAIAVHAQALEGEAFALYISVYSDFWKSIIPPEALDQLSNVSNYSEFVNWQRTSGDRGRRRVRFEVAESFAGNVGETVDVYTTTAGGAACEPYFQIGEEYLVFASEVQGQLSTSSCSGSRETSRAQEDLEYLRGYSSAARLGSLVGAVQAQDWNAEGYARSFPAVGAEIEISNGANSWKTRTDRDGRFSVPDLRPGPYSVAARYEGEPLPPGPAGIPETNPVQFVPARGCAFVVFSRPAPSGSITGRIFSPTAEPLAGIRVRAAPADGKPNGRQVLTDQDGRFRIDQIEPGGYFVGVNIDGPPTARQPYATLYYPGVPAQESAAVVQVVEGSTSDAGALRLGRRMQSRKVVGRVVGSNGEPLSEIKVSLMLEGRPYGVSDMWTGEDGSFELEGLEKTGYITRAEFRSPRDGSVISTEVPAPMTGDAPIMIVLVVP